MKATVSESLRYYLETGDYCLRERFPEDPRGWAEVFRLAYSSESMRKRLKATWLLYRGEVLRQWKAKNKKGLPWAEKIFNE